MTDKATSVAFDGSAPQDERTSALGELHQTYKPSLSDLLPTAEAQAVIDHMLDGYREDELRKASTVVPFPSKNARSGERGMQSVRLDEWSLSVSGEYWERPSMMGFDSLRAMVEQTPVLNALIMTRIRQVQRFCRVAETGMDKPGFEIRHIDRGHQLQKSEQDSIQLLHRFVSNCGWEFGPRKRKSLRRDSFSGLMAKVVRDSLTMDAAAIELEWKRDKALGIDGFYAVDGGTIRLCTEDGYEGDDEIFALQVVQGRITTPYTFDNLIYEPRNPRSDVRACGYGLSEVELLVRVVTGFLNAMTYNIKGFDSNAIPKGMLHLSGNYTTQDIDAFKRYWNGMVKGINNQWALPVMVSKDQESRAAFERFGIEFNEMYFSKWMTFLTSIICAIFGMSPSEINFDSFTGGSTSALSGSDTAEKLAASKDSGLRPLLAHFENLFTDYVLSDFSDKFVFRWTGLDPADADKKHEMRKLVLTVNEARAEEGYEAMEGELGDAPLNSSLLGPWMQIKQATEPQDFGSPQPPAVPGQGEDQEAEEDPDSEQEQESEGGQTESDGGQAGGGEELDFGKAFAPVFVIGGE